MKLPQLRLLVVACVACVAYVALLSGCAASTAQPTPSSARSSACVVYITSLEKSATPIPNILSAVDTATGNLLWRYDVAESIVTTTVGWYSVQQG